MKYFFVTGRPRSRTAWLANFLTWGDTFCFHDALRLVDDPRQIGQVFARVSHAAAVGLADPAILFFQDALRAAYPGAAWIFIDRDCRETIPAFDRVLSQQASPESIASIESHAARLLWQPGVIRVPYAQLDAFAPSLGRMVRGPQFDSPRERLSSLSRLQVQIHPGVLAEELSAGLPRGLLQHAEP